MFFFTRFSLILQIILACGPFAYLDWVCDSCTMASSDDEKSSDCRSFVRNLLRGYTPDNSSYEECLGHNLSSFQVFTKFCVGISFQNIFIILPIIILYHISNMISSAYLSYIIFHISYIGIMQETNPAFLSNIMFPYISQFLA